MSLNESPNVMALSSH